MARSKHTDPRRIRAARRVCAPYAPRGAGDLCRTRRLARAMKLVGAGPTEPAPARATKTAPLPRIYVQRPRVGYTHPATQADIVVLLRRCGEPFLYGLRAVE